ncbi:MAG: hypothetical protein ACKON9_30635, partial [Planctomycetaceae bacterium]
MPSPPSQCWPAFSVSKYCCTSSGLADLQRCAAESHCFAAGEQSLTLQYRLVAAAAELGVPLAAPGAAATATVQRLLQSQRQQDQLAALLGLRNQLGSASPELVQQYFDTL